MVYDRFEDKKLWWIAFKRRNRVTLQAVLSYLVLINLALNYLVLRMFLVLMTRGIIMRVFFLFLYIYIYS